MRRILTLSCLILGLAQAAQAETGFYSGIGVGITDTASEAPIVPFYSPSATNVSLALTAGYRWPTASAFAVGLEGNLDVHNGVRLSHGIEACNNVSPVWCEVNMTMRVRATVGKQLANGDMLMGSLGAAVVRGELEANPGDYRTSTGRGLSVGVAWESTGGKVPVRVDLNYDRINDDSDPTYERSLDMVGLRVSYMF